MKLLMRKAICYLIGHNFLIFTKENERSIFGWLYCQRCGHDEPGQYDFPSLDEVSQPTNAADQKNESRFCPDCGIADYHSSICPRYGR